MESQKMLLGVILQDIRAARLLRGPHAQALWRPIKVVSSIVRLMQPEDASGRGFDPFVGHVAGDVFGDMGSTSLKTLLRPFCHELAPCHAVCHAIGAASDAKKAVLFGDVFEKLQVGGNGLI